MDYRKILVAYMALVYEMEGTVFLWKEDLEHLGLSKDEIDELYHIQGDAMIKSEELK